ncbi:MAG: CDP-archaeol synthase [Bacteroidota bacterium]|jgi:CDP-diglyceride synthetase
MSFQFIRAAKDRVPKNHWVRNYNIDAFDFTFLDKKPFVGGGIRLTSIIPIIVLPFIFNLYMPVSYPYYLLLTCSVFIGDLLGSIIKRRLNYKKGEFMPFIDHGDYILFTGIIFIHLKFISLYIFLATLLLTYILHPLVCFMGYKIHIKKQIL